MKIRSWKKLAQCLQERYQQEFFADARKKVITARVWDRFRRDGRSWNLLISWHQGWEVSCPEEKVCYYWEQSFNAEPFSDGQLGNLGLFVGQTLDKICSTWE